MSVVHLREVFRIFECGKVTQVVQHFLLGDGPLLKALPIEPFSLAVLGCLRLLLSAFNHFSPIKASTTPCLWGLRVLCRR